MPKAIIQRTHEQPSHGHTGSNQMDLKLARSNLKLYHFYLNQIFINIYFYPQCCNFTILVFNFFLALDLIVLYRYVLLVSC